ncbi:hypothetical protein ABPG75_010980 [Micractinium tetrahymenae]
MDLPAAFSVAQPAAFYLGSENAELAGLADAALMVEGTRLPVHSHILSLQSRVLRGLFAARSEGPSRDETAPPPVATTAWSSGTLAACCRLAHQLDAPLLLSKLAARMQSEVDKEGGPGLDSLVAITRAAEHCQLEALWASCVQRLAQALLPGQQTLFSFGTPAAAAAPGPAFGALAAGFGGPAPSRAAAGFLVRAPARDGSVDDVLKLQGVSSSAQLAVLHAVVASVRQTTHSKTVRDGIQKPHANTIGLLKKGTAAQ